MEFKCLVSAENVAIKGVLEDGVGIPESTLVAPATLVRTKHVKTGWLLPLVVATSLVQAHYSPCPSGPASSVNSGTLARSNLNSVARLSVLPGLNLCFFFSLM